MLKGPGVNPPMLKSIQVLIGEVGHAKKISNIPLQSCIPHASSPSVDLGW